MQRIDRPFTNDDLSENLSWLGSARKPQTDEPIYIKAPVRINRGKFPCDFFSNLNERKASIKLRPLEVLQPMENNAGTPKFSSYASNIPRLVFAKLNNDSTSDETTLASFASHRNTSREHTACGGNPRALQTDRTVTAREAYSHDDDTKLFNNLRDIVKLTTSMKRVYRKQSLEIRRNGPEPRSKRPAPFQLGSLELPPLTLKRGATAIASEPQSVCLRPQ